MNPEKPIWLWQNNNEYALFQLLLLIIGVYLLTKFVAHLTHRFELIRNHGKRLDRLAFKTNCNRKERELLQNFYFQLKSRHRVLLAHNHIKDYLRFHLLTFISQRNHENPECFLSLVSKLLGSARGKTDQIQTNEFVMFSIGNKVEFGQVSEESHPYLKINFSNSKSTEFFSVGKKAKLTIFRESSGYTSYPSEILEKSKRSLSVLRLTK